MAPRSGRFLAAPGPGLYNASCAVDRQGVRVEGMAMPPEETVSGRAGRRTPGAWSPSLAPYAEEVLNRFQEAWRSGARPRIEAYLGDTPEPARSVMLRELLALELAHRWGKGEVPAP